MTATPLEVKMIVFREVLPGDIKKQNAQSNIATSGGGARDLRFRGEQWIKVLGRMFTTPTDKPGVLSAAVHWLSPEKSVKSVDIKWWRETSARPNETRIARINQIPAWAVDHKKFAEDHARGVKWFFVLFQDKHDKVWASLARQSELRHQLPQIAEFIEEEIRETPMGHTVAGAKDCSSAYRSVSLGLTDTQAAELKKITDDVSVSSEKLAQVDELTRDRDLEKLLAEWSKKNRGMAPEEMRGRVTRLKRCVAMVSALKKKYGHKCQILSCGFTFKMRNGKYYCEAAHINPISRRKAGLDTPENILILCPNHHKMLDYGAMRIVSLTEVEIDGKIHKLNRR